MRLDSHLAEDREKCFAKAIQRLLRIEDIDSPREQPGAAEEIMRMLGAFGLDWDGPVVFQSRRTARYEEALRRKRRTVRECRRQVPQRGGSRRARAAPE